MASGLVVGEEEGLLGKKERRRSSGLRSSLKRVQTRSEGLGKKRVLSNSDCWQATPHSEKSVRAFSDLRPLIDLTRVWTSCSKVCAGRMGSFSSNGGCVSTSTSTQRVSAAGSGGGLGADGGEGGGGSQQGMKVMEPMGDCERGPGLTFFSLLAWFLARIVLRGPTMTGKKVTSSPKRFQATVAALGNTMSSSKTEPLAASCHPEVSREGLASPRD